LASLVGKPVEEINPIIDETIKESIASFQIFKINFYAKKIAEKFNNKNLEKKLIEMFDYEYPYDEAIFKDVVSSLTKLSGEFILGIQSDGEHKFQLRKIKSLTEFFDKKYIFIFKNKKEEVIKKIKLIKNKIIIIDDRPDYIDMLIKNGINAILINRGPYAADYNKNPKDYPHILKSVDDLVDFSKLISYEQ